MTFWKTLINVLALYRKAARSYKLASLQEIYYFLINTHLIMEII